MISGTVIGATEVSASLEAKIGASIEAISSALLASGIDLKSHIMIDKLSGQVLTPRSDRLRGSINASGVTNAGGSLRVTVGTNVEYARIHELGGVIHGAPWLRFQTRDGSWHTVAQVTMPARPYMKPALEEKAVSIRERISAAIGEALHA